MAKATCARTRTLARSLTAMRHAPLCGLCSSQSCTPRAGHVRTALCVWLSAAVVAVHVRGASSSLLSGGRCWHTSITIRCTRMLYAVPHALTRASVAMRGRPTTSCARPCALAYCPYTHAQVYSMGLRPNSRARSDAGPGPAYMLQDSIGAQTLSNRGSAPRWQFGSNARFRSTLTTSCTCTRARGQQCTPHSTQRKTPNTALWHKHSSGSARRCRCGRCRCGRIVFSARHTSSRNERQPLPPAGSARANHSEAISERWDKLPATAGVDLSGRVGPAGVPILCCGGPRPSPLLPTANGQPR
jgi:hypothetical protein